MRYLATLVLMLVTLAALAQQTIAPFGHLIPGQPMNSLTGVNTTGAGQVFQAPMHIDGWMGDSFGWQAYYTGTPTSITMALEGSVNGKLLSDGQATNASATFKSNSAGFVASDAGATVYIPAMNAANLFITTISTVTNATTVQLANNATFTDNGVTFWYGKFATLDSSTATAGEIKFVSGKPVRFLRCNITAYVVNGSTASCTILPK